MAMPGSGQIWMSGVMCGMSDSSLADCPFDGWGVIPNQCSHSMDVQLTCQGTYLASTGDRVIITFLIFTGILQSMFYNDDINLYCFVLLQLYQTAAPSRWLKILLPFRIMLGLRILVLTDSCCSAVQL